MLVEVIKPWRYSRHGHDVNDAAPGDMLDIPDDLARDGIATGHVKSALAKQAAAGAPERKTRRRSR